MDGAEDLSRRRTVLIIDDSQLVRARLKQLARQMNFELVGIAETGAEGVAKASSLRPGLILLDHQLPDAFGEEVARQIRSAGVESKIVAITGTITQEISDSFIAAGVEQVLSKPVDPVQLAAAVQACGFPLYVPPCT